MPPPPPVRPSPCRPRLPGRSPATAAAGSETSSAAITAAAPSSAEHKALVPVARPAAAPGLPRQIEQVDYLRAPVLEYPSASRRYGEQGRVVLRVLIGRDGQAEKVELHEPSAFPRLNDTAIEAARRALFSPPRMAWRSRRGRWWRCRSSCGAELGPMRSPGHHERRC